MFRFAHRGAFFEQGSGRTGHDTFAAVGATGCLPPRLIEVGDDLRFSSAAGNILGSGALDVPADADAAGAEDASIVVHTEQTVRGIDFPSREKVFVADMVHALRIG